MGCFGRTDRSPTALRFNNESATVRHRLSDSGALTRRDRQIRRALFWTVYSIERTYLITSIQPISFRNDDICVGLPSVCLSAGSSTKDMDIGSPSDFFDNGLGDFAGSAHARDFFLAYVLELAASVHARFSHVVRKTGSYVIPRAIVEQITRVLELLKEHYEAEILFCPDGPSFGDEILCMPAKGTLAAQGLLPYGPEALIPRKLTKTAIYHGFASNLLAPRADIQSFIVFNDTHLEARETRDLVNRLRDWIALGELRPSDEIPEGYDKDDVLATAASVRLCSDHVAMCAQALQELLPFNDSLVLVRTLCPWTAMSCDVLDLVLFCLGKGAGARESAQRIPIYLSWLNSSAVANSWPSIKVFGLAFGYFCQQATILQAAIEAGALSEL